MLECNLMMACLLVLTLTLWMGYTGGSQCWGRKWVRLPPQGTVVNFHGNLLWADELHFYYMIFFHAVTATLSWPTGTRLLYHPLQLLFSCSFVPTLCNPMDPQACQASLSFTISWSLLKPVSIELVMPSSHLILHCPLLLLNSIFPSIRVFSSELTLCIRWPSFGASASALVFPVDIQGWKLSPVDPPLIPDSVFGWGWRTGKQDPGSIYTRRWRRWKGQEWWVQWVSVRTAWTNTMARSRVACGSLIWAVLAILTSVKGGQAVCTMKPNYGESYVIPSAIMLQWKLGLGYMHQHE